MKVSIVIPAYNEEKRIGETLQTYSKYFENLRKNNKLDYELLIAINNTSDKTLDIVKKHKKSNKRISYINLPGSGKGYAIAEGFKDALKRNNNFIGFVDADMATPPEAFNMLINEINNYDGVIASRWISGSVIKTKQTIVRRIMSLCFNFLVRSFFMMPYRDTQCGAKLFKREAVKAIIGEIGLTRWAFDVDLLYRERKKGFVIKEIPTIWEDKKNSHLSIIRAPLEMFLGITRLRLINSPFKFIVSAYDKLPEYLKIDTN